MHLFSDAHFLIYVLGVAIVAVLITCLCYLVIRFRRQTLQLREGSARLSNILDNTVDGFITINDLGIVESFNAASERIFGYTAAEVIGHNVKMLMPQRYSAAHDGYLHNYMTTGQTKIIGIGREVEGLRKDGSEFPLDLSVSEVVINGRRVFSGIIRDITYRKQVEEARDQLITKLTASNTQLEQFAYICSHDLQEPLRMISNYTQRLQQHLQGSLDEKGVHYMKYIVDGAAHARRLINDVLALARIGAENNPNEAADCNIILATVREGLAERLQETRGEVTADALPTVWVHRIHVVQLFQNLIGNALKFCRDEPPRIHVSAHREKGGYWQFSITDNGIGIAPEYHEKIFAIFQRLHSRDAYAGTGIGLTIVRKIVQHYDGRIWLTSTPGKGTTFYFTLPGTD